MGYETMAREELAFLPTPLEELKRLRRRIGGPRLFIKRDDLTGLGLGGNKTRKLEFLLGDALSKGADTIITSGGLQTNHGRLTAAACAKLGLECYVVLTEEDDGVYEGNRILEYFFGAREVFCDIDYSVAPEALAREKLRAGEERIARLVKELTAEGRRPYVIPRGGRSLQGTAGYCRAMDEVREQLDSLNVKLDYIIAPCATSSTLTGITLGNRVSGINARIIGVALSRSVEEGKKMLCEEFNRDAESLGYAFAIEEEQVEILGGYIGEGYGIPTQAGMEAIRLVAREEGILLDPVYSGKTMSAYVDLVSKGFFKETDTVLFVHSGGTPLLFLKNVESWIKKEKAKC